LEVMSIICQNNLNFKEVFFGNVRIKKMWKKI
jgi:hypothetical protein